MKEFGETISTERFYPTPNLNLVRLNPGYVESGEDMIRRVRARAELTKLSNRSLSGIETGEQSTN